MAIKSKEKNDFQSQNVFEKMPEIEKSEVIQETNFYKEMEKYEGKETINFWPIIIIALAIIALIIILI